MKRMYWHRFSRSLTTQVDHHMFCIQHLTNKHSNSYLIDLINHYTWVETKAQISWVNIIDKSGDTTWKGVWIGLNDTLSISTHLPTIIKVDYTWKELEWPEDNERSEPYLYPASLRPVATMVSAVCWMSFSLILHPKWFQLFHPILKEWTRCV